jgi:hypothetical protein
MKNSDVYTAAAASWHARIPQTQTATIADHNVTSKNFGNQLQAEVGHGDSTSSIDSSIDSGKSNDTVGVRL